MKMYIGYDPIVPTHYGNKTILFDFVNAPVLHVFLQATHLVYLADYLSLDQRIVKSDILVMCIKETQCLLFMYVPKVICEIDIYLYCSRCFS